MNASGDYSLKILVTYFAFAIQCLRVILGMLLHLEGTLLPSAIVVGGRVTRPLLRFAGTHAGVPV